MLTVTQMQPEHYSHKMKHFTEDFEHEGRTSGTLRKSVSSTYCYK